VSLTSRDSSPLGSSSGEAGIRATVNQRQAAAEMNIQTWNDSLHQGTRRVVVCSESRSVSEFPPKSSNIPAREAAACRRSDRKGCKSNMVDKSLLRRLVGPRAPRVGVSVTRLRLLARGWLPPNQQCTPSVLVPIHIYFVSKPID